MEAGKKARLSLFAVSLVGAASIAAPAVAIAGSGSNNSTSVRQDCQSQGVAASFDVPGASHGNFWFFSEGCTNL
jgi:hypothetical protein